MPQSPLDLKAAVVCITGGGSGIGLGLAEQFLKAGSKVIITGRRESALEAAQEKFPNIHTFQNDAAKSSERTKLVTWLIETHPNTNILVNNAGIMRRVNASCQEEDWAETQSEIVINLEAPIHLMQLLTPHFLKQPQVGDTRGCHFAEQSPLPHSWLGMTGCFREPLIWTCVCPTNLRSCL